MEIMKETDESSEIFKDCNNREIKQEDLEKISSNDTNLGGNYDGKRYEESLKYTKDNTNNNNHHVVPVGIIMLLITIYLGMTSVQKCLVSCVEENIAKEQTKQPNKELLMDLYKPTYKENSVILERLLEYKDICKDLEIFTKDKNMQQEDAENEQSTYEILEQFKAISNGEAGGEDGSSIQKDNNDANDSSGSESCVKESRNKNKKSKYAIKSSPNTKNGFNKYNKSSKAKYNKNNKKELNLNKKNSTAEPIIYMFALVFIYLLLKAASDINQHYKSQNKNEKRLRRCSLQSYAQTHRPDRRASKELALKQKPQRQRLKSLSQSSNQGQQYHHPQTPTQHQLQQHVINALPEKSEQKHITKSGSPIDSKMTYSRNWQILRQHTTTQSLDRSDLLANTVGGCNGGVCNKELLSHLVARRSSVPVALSYQKQKMSAVSPLSTVSDHNVNALLNRRTSITSPSLMAMDPGDSFLPEIKRRVRMINRH